MANRRDGIGVVKKSAPRIGTNLNANDIQRAIDTIYSDLNSLFDSVNRPNSTSAIENFKGKTGDIRLYKGAGQDGSSGYFLQGKFDDGWATVHLSLDQENPSNVETSSDTAQSSGPEPFITKYGVTYNHLSLNQSVGANANQVAIGNHKHLDHWTSAYDSLDSSDQQAMINTIHFPLQTASQSNTTIDSSASTTGSSGSAARADHTHKLNMDSEYIWKANHKFGNSYGNDGVTTTFNGPTTGTGLALDIHGDVAIDGNLTVSYADTQSNATDLQNAVTLNSANVSSGQMSSYAYKTTIHGPTLLESGLKIDKAAITNNNQWHHSTSDAGKPPLLIENTGAEGQMRLQYDNANYFDFKIDSGGNLLLAPTGNIQLMPNGSNWLDPGEVLPKSSGTINLGSDLRKWNTIVANELRIDNLVAQEVMATIGGVILVAPTNTITRDLGAADTNIYLEYNDPNFRSSWVECKSGGNFEAFYITSSTPIQQPAGDWKYVCQNRNADGSNTNSWPQGTAIVATGNSSDNVDGNKGFIELSSTGTEHNSYGPRMTLYARKNDDGNLWNSAAPIVNIGVLKDLVDYNSNNNTHGFIIGNDVRLSTANGFKGLTADASDGLKLYNTDIELYNNANKKVELLSDGRFRIGAGLTLTNGNWDTAGQGEVLKFDPATGQLTISGTINVTGGTLPSGNQFDSIETDLSNLSTQLNNLDVSGMSDYAAAQSIVSSVGGNIILDSDMEFSPTAESGYTNLQLWKSGTTGFYTKDSNLKFNGAQSLEVQAKHQSLVGNSAQHVDVYQTDLGGNLTFYPVVPGMKVTVKFQARMNWINYGAGTEADNPTITNNLFSVGVRIYNSDRTSYTWQKIASTGQADNNNWKEYIGSFTIPTERGTDPNKWEPAYIVPWIQGDTWGNANHTGYGSFTQKCNLDDIEMYLDSSLAAPAAPTDTPAFHAGSDIFGIHDGANWRTRFQVTGGNSYMVLSKSNGDDVFTFDGSDLKLGINASNNPNITLNGTTGDVDITGSLKVGNNGSVGTSGGYNSSGDFFLGDVGGVKKFSVVANTGQYIPGTTTQPKILFDASTGQLELDALLNRVYYAPLTNSSDFAARIISEDSTGFKKMLPIYHQSSHYIGTSSLNDSDGNTTVGSSASDPGEVYETTIINVGYYSRVEVDCTYTYANNRRESNDDLDYQPRVIYRVWNGSDWSSWVGGYGVWNYTFGQNTTSSESGGWHHGNHNHGTPTNGRMNITWSSVIVMNGYVAQHGNYASRIQIKPIDYQSKGRDDLHAVIYKIRVDNTRS